jgi:hypothetical protein
MASPESSHSLSRSAEVVQSFPSLRGAAAIRRRFEMATKHRRQGDVAEALPGRRAVQHRGVIEGGRYLLETGQERKSSCRGMPRQTVAAISEKRADQGSPNGGAKAGGHDAKIRLTALLNFLLFIHLGAPRDFAADAPRAGIHQAPSVGRRCRYFQHSVPGV